MTATETSDVSFVNTLKNGYGQEDEEEGADDVVAEVEPLSFTPVF